jgi:hypothetical protein
MNIELPVIKDADRRCQGPTTQDTCCPWDGTPRSEDHDALERILIESPAGAPAIWFARTLFGPDVKSGDADWKFVKRHGERHHEVKRPTSKIAVQVAPGEYENRKTEADFVWIFPTQTTPTPDVLDNRSGKTEHEHDSTALARAEGYLSRREALSTVRAWGGLVEAFGGKRLGEERADGGPERTRFNDVARALGGRDRVWTAFAGAEERGYRRGALVTATTAPDRFESIMDAADGPLDDVKLLRRWLDRPPGVTVVEPTERGVPHTHLVVFRPPQELPTKRELHDYWWVNRERGQQVDIMPLEAAEATSDNPAEAWMWADESSENMTSTRPLSYLSEGAKALATVAELRAGDVLAAGAAFRDVGDAELDATTADERDCEIADAGALDNTQTAAAVRQAAWYFGTGLRTVTRPSPLLRKAAEGVAATVPRKESPEGGRTEGVDS